LAQGRPPELDCAARAGASFLLASASTGLALEGDALRPSSSYLQAFSLVPALSGAPCAYNVEAQGRGCMLQWAPGGGGSGGLVCNPPSAGSPAEFSLLTSRLLLVTSGASPLAADASRQSVAPMAWGDPDFLVKHVRAVDMGDGERSLRAQQPGGRSEAAPLGADRLPRLPAGSLAQLVDSGEQVQLLGPQGPVAFNSYTLHAAAAGSGGHPRVTLRNNRGHSCELARVGAAEEIRIVCGDLVTAPTRFRLSGRGLQLGPRRVCHQGRGEALSLQEPGGGQPCSLLLLGQGACPPAPLGHRCPCRAAFDPARL
jgi:hypothetical protein